LLSLPLALATGAAALSANAAVIDGTTGSNTDATAYSTDGNLDLSLGFVAEYLIVGGGGGGGSDIGGGGGAGRFIEGSLNTIMSQSYTVTVGAGGAGGTVGAFGQNGGNSSVFDIIAPGGGGGGYFGQTGRSGGSGGGGGANAGTGGAATTGTGAVGLGHAGGNATVGAAAAAVGAGGGGAVFLASQFIDGYNQKGGNGGTGATSTITGVSEEYAGGGGGGINDDPFNTSANGPGFGSAGGGNGAGASTAATDALANSGSGGGGGANLAARKAGGAGGSGIVVVRYQGTAAATGTNGGGPTTGTGTAAGYTVHEFKTTGDSTLDFSGTDMNTRLGATLTSGITGTGNLTFSGPGTLTLNAANTYGGSTTVSAGTLAIGAAGSIANTTGVAIASGATFDVSAASGFAIGSSQTLSGVGTVEGAISIAGTHSPGSSPGLQTFDSNLTYTAGANVDWELIANNAAVGDAGTDYDQIAVGGNLDFAGTTTLDLIFDSGTSAVDWSNTFWQSDRAWLVWDLSTGTTSNFNNLSITSATWLDAQGDSFATVLPNASFTLSLVGQDVSLVYTAVPEPGTLVMLPAAGLAFLGLRQLRHRKTARGTGHVTA